MHPQSYVERLTAFGFNHRPDGLLSHPAFGAEVITTVTFDWFHIYCVHGVANICTGQMLDALRSGGWTHQQVDDFVSSFHWPHRLSGAAPKNLLQKRSVGDRLTGSASECLNFVVALRVFLVLFVMPACPENMRAKCNAWLQLAKVLDMLAVVNSGKITPVTLQAQIKAHLDATLQVYGSEWWIPKCHMALHLPHHLRAHGMLQSCFVHERKHKIVKNIANQMLDTSKAFEKSILEDILFSHIGNLDDLRWQGSSVGPHPASPRQAPK